MFTLRVAASFGISFFSQLNATWCSHLNLSYEPFFANDHFQRVSMTVFRVHLLCELWLQSHIMDGSLYQNNLKMHETMSPCDNVLRFQIKAYRIRALSIKLVFLNPKFYLYDTFPLFPILFEFWAEIRIRSNVENDLKCVHNVIWYNNGAHSAFQIVYGSFDDCE